MSRLAPIRRRIWERRQSDEDVRGPDPLPHIHRRGYEQGAIDEAAGSRLAVPRAPAAEEPAWTNRT